MIGSEDNESRCRTIREEHTSEIVADSVPPSTAGKQNRSGHSPALQEVLTFSADSHEQEEQSFLAGKILSAVQQHLSLVEEQQETEENPGGTEAVRSNSNILSTHEELADLSDPESNCNASSPLPPTPPA